MRFYLFAPAWRDLYSRYNREIYFILTHEIQSKDFLPNKIAKDGSFKTIPHAKDFRAQLQWVKFTVQILVVRKPDPLAV